MAKYAVQVSCPECSGQHDTGIKLSLQDGPADEQSIGDFYHGKEFPPDIVALNNNTYTCPRTARNFDQNNHSDVFLVRIED